MCGRTPRHRNSSVWRAGRAIAHGSRRSARHLTPRIGWASAGVMGTDRQADGPVARPAVVRSGAAARSYCAFMFTGLKSSLPWK
jgi:hypothetical protein